MTSEMVPEERPENWPLQSFDAKDWAQEFMRIFDKRRDEIDEALMLGWFANALMRGFDEHAHRHTRPAPALSAADADEIVRLEKAVMNAQRTALLASPDTDQWLKDCESLGAAQAAFEAKIKELRA